MLQLASALWTGLETCLWHAGTPTPVQVAYTNWLRSDLEFCQKHHVSHAPQASLPHFFLT
jgi:hypothetical protein